MNCISCGAQCPEQAAFCTNCGAAIEVPAADQPEEELAPALPKAQDELSAEEKREENEPAVPVIAPAFADGPKPEDRPVSAGAFFWLTLFGILPVVGLLLHIGIVNRAVRTSLKNYCVAMLIWHSIFMVLTLAGLVLGMIYLDQVNDFLSRAFEIQIVPRF